MKLKWSRVHYVWYEAPFHLLTLFSCFSSLPDHTLSLESNVFIQSALITSAVNKAYLRRFLISQSNAARRLLMPPLSCFTSTQTTSSSGTGTSCWTRNSKSDWAAGRMRALDLETNKRFHCKHSDEHMQTGRFSQVRWLTSEGKGQPSHCTYSREDLFSKSCSDSGPEKLGSSSYLQIILFIMNNSALSHLQIHAKHCKSSAQLTNAY